MRPVAIFRHYVTEGPGYFATYLDRRGLPWRLIRIDEGDCVPVDPGAFCGLAFMGGPMSVNDELPWIAPVLELIRRAVADNLPVVGHCLGGQLMSKALDGRVSRNPVMEIGWGEVEVAAVPAARQWFDGLDRFESFHWHGETFTVPPGATRILGGRWCENQAFALGPHLAMQCHVEMTEDLVRTWCRAGAREIAQNKSPAVQSPDEIQRNLPERIAALNAVADRIYERWIEGLRG